MTVGAGAALSRRFVDATRTIRWSWIVPLTVGLAIVTVPSAITSSGVGLDPSWVIGLHMAYAAHLQWGSQVIWTYGPYGFLNYVDYYDFGTWLVALLTTLVIHATLFVSVTAYLVRVGARPWQGLVVGVAFLLPVMRFLSPDYELLLAAMLLLVIAATTSAVRPAVASAAAAGVVMSMLLLVKDTGIVTVIAMLAPYVLYVSVIRRWWLLAPLLGSGSLAFLLLWALAGQSPSHIGVYFRSAFEIVDGYTPAMSILNEAPVKDVGPQVAVGVAVVAGAAMALLWSLARRDRELAGLQLLATPLLFFAFKEGYVRFGDRQLEFYALAMLIEAFVFVWAMKAQSRSVRVVSAVQSGTALVTCAVLLAGLAYVEGGVPYLLPWPAPSLHDRLATYVQAVHLVHHTDARVSLAESNRAAARAAYGLRPQDVALLREGTVDVIPWDIALVDAYHLNWAPRPVLQSYAAYTPYLDKADAAYFRSPEAPTHLLFVYEDIDGRYPLYDEPETFRAIASNYMVVGRDGEMLILALRAPHAGPGIQTHVITQAHGQLGDLIEVPRAGPHPVYAAITVPYSPRGRVTSLLYQPGELHLQIRLVDGSTSPPYRLVPAVASDGLLVSAYVGNAAELGQYLQAGTGRSVESLQLLSDRPQDYSGNLGVTFYTVG